MFKKTKLQKQASQKTKLQLISQKLLGFVLYCFNFILCYFMFKKDFYLLALLFISVIYQNIRSVYPKSEFYNATYEKDDYRMLVRTLKNGMVLIHFDVIFYSIVLALFLIQAFRVDIHIALIVIAAFMELFVIISYIMAIVSQYEIIKIAYPDTEIISKEDILDVIKYVTLSINKYHSVIILTKVLPEHISEQQKEELEQFFLETLIKCTCLKLFEQHQPHVGQYSDNQFILCYNNCTTPIWEDFFREFDSFNDVNSDQSLEMLTTFDHDKLKESNGQIVPYTYTCAYHLPDSKKPVTLKWLYKKASALYFY